MLKTDDNKAIIKILQENLIEWFRIEKRDLPFRQTKDPYAIWISEIMAQQTQIDTLIPYYNRFMEKFPDVGTLAEASEESVIKSWEGLGYYSRARNLHKAAKLIVQEHQGIFPNTFPSLIKLPGIGPYTGGAIASIAFNERVSAVDGNVLRVISRFCNSRRDIGDEKTKKIITQWIEEILPPAVGDFNEGIMELGALICTPQNPKCSLCPIQLGCQSFKNDSVHEIPVKKKKQKQIRKKMEVAFVEYDHSYYFVKRPTSGLLSEMWSFPIVEENLGNGEDIKSILLESFSFLNPPVYLGESRHVFSHVIWEMKVYHFKLSTIVSESKEPYFSKPSKDQFKSIDAIDELALPIAFSKLLPLITK
ncbi:MAG: A/G-specific adenine glycosylase [Eubacteriaceae bacterium]